MKLYPKILGKKPYIPTDYKSILKIAIRENKPIHQVVNELLLKFPSHKPKRK